MRLATFTRLSLPLLLACCSLAQSDNITLAIVWNEPGAAAVVKDLFQRKFLPDLVSACSSVPGASETGFEFVEIVQTKLLDIGLARDQLSNLTRCLFAGAHSESPVAPLLAQAAPPSGVARYPAMRLHEVAPIPVPAASAGLFGALAVALAGPPTDTELFVILGAGYQLHQLGQLAGEFPGSVRLHRLVRGAEDAIVEAAKAAEVTEFLLAAAPHEAEALLEAAFVSRMLEPGYRWFLFDTLMVERNNFNGIRVVSKNITSMEFGPISTAISNKLNTTLSIYAYDLLTVWSVYFKNILCNEPEEVNTTVTGLTGSFRLSPNGTVTRLDWSMYYYRGLGQERERIGNWSSSGLFHFDPPVIRVPTDDILKVELAKNLFRVVTLLIPPYVKYKKGYESLTNVTLYDRLEGFAIDICKEILKNMTLTNVEFFLQPDSQFGIFDEREGWNGVVATLMQGAASMACVPMTNTAQRRHVMQFSQPYLPFQLSVLYAKPAQNPLELMFQFLLPMHRYTWLAVLGSVLASALVVAILHRLSRNNNSFSLYETVFISFASLIQGLTGNTPNRPSGQLVTAVYWLFAFVFLVTYVTNYAARRTLERLQSEITEIGSLSSQVAYEYGTLAGSVYLDFLQYSNDPQQVLVYQHATADPSRQPRDNDHAVQLVANGSFAFIYSSEMNKYYKQLICNSEVTGSFSHDSAVFGLPPYAEYAGMINRVIQQLVESGERDLLYKRYFELSTSERPDCNAQPFPYNLKQYIPLEPASFDTKKGALTLHNTLGIAVINLVGCLLTLLLASVELTYQVCRLRLRRHRDRANRAQTMRGDTEAVAAWNDPHEQQGTAESTV